MCNYPNNGYRCFVFVVRNKNTMRKRETDRQTEIRRATGRVLHTERKIERNTKNEKVRKERNKN